ncbi:rSAM/selenodomain-associated transferase 2 [Rhodoligotrophos appendicifer]|uniref:TIGR04283 family arsenosugar biosynthesis glycosyltransferase n=1 Tax=Rhodoligotrophos appendicifer TaxID=987056 RepID=UPI00118592DC|nr:TIGR04283 family arsenosugar biosynthesis glycosyltransferase [Rhodoligotrophos appendicifer]
MNSTKFQGLSIIIPTLNEGKRIGRTLRSLVPLRERGAEIVVVDGGSSDCTQEVAVPLADLVMGARRGRARQMNAGTTASKGHLLLFLHADTELSEEAMLALQSVLENETVIWGRFDVRIGDGHSLLRIVAEMMNLRSRLTGIATGDQAIFVRRPALEDIGGFPDIPIMEDIAVSRRLKSLARPVCLGEKVTTSSRRWEKNGIVLTIALMWWLRLAYWAHVNPRTLARWYGVNIDAS